jgi:hypothetical protein
MVTLPPGNAHANRPGGGFRRRVGGRVRPSLGDDERSYRATRSSRPGALPAELIGFDCFDTQTVETLAMAIQQREDEPLSPLLAPHQ